MAKKLDDISKRQNAFVDATVEVFERELAAIVSRAQTRLLAKIQAKLEIVDGQIARTAANQALLRKLDKLFLAEMKKSGYEALIDETVKSFARQMPFFEEILEFLDLPKVTWSKEDRDLFAGEQMNASDGLRGVVAAAAERAKRKALFSIGGTPMGQLAELLATEYGKTMPQAASLADTSMSVFYRTISARGYERIEATSGEPIFYEPYGPDDKLTRPFCKRVLDREKPYSRAEIDALKNGQIPDVFTSFGGYNCRHQWIIASGKKTKSRDKRTPDEALDDLIGAANQIQDEIDYLKRLEKDAQKEGDERRSTDAFLKRVDLQRTTNDRLADVLAAEKPAKFDVKYGKAQRGLLATWKRGVERFARLAGERPGLDEVSFRSGARRAHYAPGIRTVSTSALTDEGTVVHELGHYLELSRPEIRKMVLDWFDRRTKGEKAEPLSRLTGKQYGPSEVAKKDKFLDPYVGKIYPTADDGRPFATEVVSMGLEWLATDPLRLVEDEDYFKLLWRVLRSPKVLLEPKKRSGKIKP